MVSPPCDKLFWTHGGSLLACSQSFSQIPNPWIPKHSGMFAWWMYHRYFSFLFYTLFILPINDLEKETGGREHHRKALQTPGHRLVHCTSSEPRSVSAGRCHYWLIINMHYLKPGKFQAWICHQRLLLFQKLTSHQTLYPFLFSAWSLPTCSWIAVTPSSLVFGEQITFSRTDGITIWSLL